MTREGFELAARQQNQERDRQVAEARATGAACSIVTMFALGGADYCTTHRVMGPCPFGGSK